MGPGTDSTAWWRKRPLGHSVAAVGILAVLFVVFHAKAVGAYFADDEMMNIFGYWQPPWWKVVLANFTFWSKFSRPLGAAYYLSLYHLFGLDPIPYNMVRLVLLAANTALFYFLAKRISRSWWTATLAALPISYHAGMVFLAYRGSFIYDILCAGFYFAAVLYYSNRRRRGAVFDIPQTCLFLILYICALDAKEMAVTLPVVILGYELLFRGAKANLVPGLIATTITAIFVVGKTMGPGTLIEMDAYRPVFSWTRFSEFSVRSLNTLAYTELFTIGLVLALWTAIFGFALFMLRRRDPRWMFWWIWIMITPLPIAFLPNRGGPMLYIPAAGWAMLTAMGLRTLARHAARFRMPGLSQRAAMATVLIVLAAAYAYESRRLEKDQVIATLSSGTTLRRLLGDLKDLGFRPRSGSRLVFLNDPLPDGYATEFAAYLTWDDHSLDIVLQRQVNLTPDAIAGMDYVFDFVDGRLAVKKPAR